MNCVTCGGPLPVDSDVCKFCGVLNDSDLRRLYDASVESEGASNKICPRCNINLETIKVLINKNFSIERCKNCLGIFFDPLELEDLITAVIEEDKKSGSQRLGLMTEGAIDKWPIKYLRCPVCKNLMLRKSYGNLTGVIIDWCKSHGVWLDGGELGSLLKWMRSGGYRSEEEFKIIRANFSKAYGNRVVISRRQKIASQRNTVMSKFGKRYEPEIPGNTDSRHTEISSSGKKYEPEIPTRRDAHTKDSIQHRSPDAISEVSQWGQRLEPEIPDKKTEFNTERLPEINPSSFKDESLSSHNFGESDFGISTVASEFTGGPVENQFQNTSSEGHNYEQSIQKRNTQSRRLEISEEDEAFLDSAVMFFTGFVE